MSRIVQEIEISGKRLRALFDTGAANSYILRKHLPVGVPRWKITPVTIGLGGARRRLNEECGLVASLGGLEFSTDATVVDDLGDVDGQSLDMIVGARTMEKYAIRLDPKAGTLDLSGLQRREFTEF